MTFNFSLGTLVWISVKPVIKNVIPGLVGAQLVRSGKLGSEGLKAAAQIQIYGALPCLMFSNLVPSITAENSKNVVICIAFGIFYMGMSYVLARLLMIFVVVPDHFRNGFLVAAVWSNWGNLPLSVIQSLASEPPFGKVGQVDLGVAYGSFFVLVNNLSMFAGPGITLIQRDFLDQSIEDDRQIKRSQSSRTIRRIPYSILSSEHAEDRIALPGEEIYSPPSSSFFSREPSGSDSPRLDHSSTSCGNAVDAMNTTKQPLLRRLSGVLEHVFSPVSVAMGIGLITAVIPPLKHLFVKPIKAGIDYPVAPDGRPVLSVFIDATAYLGASAIPLSLIVTGASFARMSISRQMWPSLPLWAIFGLALMKLFLMPIIGLSLVYGLDQLTDIFAGEDHELLKMICIYYSCSVTSTNQISLSALAAAEMGQESNADLLCAFIVIQYLLYPIAGTIDIAAGIKMLF
ncbi:hypothetical protein CROQUDRAFT_655788 [Cronartium quercuum f. sp. fusiforme G11]|uniref:PIN-like protein n=1 Tax=Cronartium quercuum f. sp. fusiforme G11 TaxID=708437 RepID=A0A9P6TDJ9_9BASI|nr:hypothetical protein CROQUDRAFT_655788 [Cronartium quercuum f. sp. fusiforme G11]